MGMVFSFSRAGPDGPGSVKGGFLSSSYKNGKKGRKRYVVYPLRGENSLHFCSRTGKAAETGVRPCDACNVFFLLRRAVYAAYEEKKEGASILEGGTGMEKVTILKK